jgi:hypothetical protein
MGHALPINKKYIASQSLESSTTTICPPQKKNNKKKKLKKSDESKKDRGLLSLSDKNPEYEL